MGGYTTGETADLYDSTGAWVGVIDRNGHEQRVNGGFVANELLLEAAINGDSTGWLRTFPGMERYMLQAKTTGNAIVNVDGSYDGVFSAGNAFDWEVTDTTMYISPQCHPLYPFIKFTVVYGTVAVDIGRGA